MNVRKYRGSISARKIIRLCERASGAMVLPLKASRLRAIGQGMRLNGQVNIDENREKCG